MIVFGKPKIRYGNVWAFTSMLVLKSQRQQSPIFLSTQTRRFPWILEIWNECLETGSAALITVDGSINKQRGYGVPEHKEPYVRTKEEWHKKRYNRICYQLKTKHARRHPDKVFRGNVKRTLKKIQSLGVEVVPLGLPLIARESISAAATSDFFVGICSGMAHLCHSVGVPILLQDWKQLSKFHPNKVYGTYKNEDDLFDKIVEFYDGK